jgi:hypothetical protein
MFAWIERRRRLCYKAVLSRNSMHYYGIFTPSLHASCAINPENLSVDPFAILTCKETDNPRNIDW